MAFVLGDVVGCGYHEAKGEIFFTKNGRVVKSLLQAPKSSGLSLLEGAGGGGREERRERLGCCCWTDIDDAIFFF